MTVAQDTDLRQKIRGDEQQVSRREEHAGEDCGEGNAGREAVASRFEGSTAIAYNRSDPVALAKALTAYAKDQSAVCFQGRHGRRSRRQHRRPCNAIAALPSKEELIAKLLFLINAPAQRIAVATNGVARNLAVVVGQAVEQKKFQE